jgi:hypothetical protein
MFQVLRVAKRRVEFERVELGNGPQGVDIQFRLDN